jgi:hypothetical protein
MSTVTSKVTVLRIAHDGQPMSEGQSQQIAHLQDGPEGEGLEAQTALEGAKGTRSQGIPGTSMRHGRPLVETIGRRGFSHEAATLMGQQRSGQPGRGDNQAA